MARKCIFSNLTLARITAKLNPLRTYSGISRKLVLGIETSCDDTGAAVVDDNGHVLGESLHSQKQTHIDNGGIIPPIARDLHKQHIDEVVKTALNRANVTLKVLKLYQATTDYLSMDLDAIATTVKPGLAICLAAGMEYGKQLCRMSGKPFIPIHHMEAHALTVRITQKVQFPFLTLLVSGGHCLLSVVQSVDKFILLGKGLDDAPGEAFDKAARRLKLTNLSEYSTKSVGESIEIADRRGNPLAFSFTMPLTSYQNWVEGGNVLPNFSDVCASFQWAITQHLLQRVHRGIIYAEREGLIQNDNRVLVVSGGVADE